MKQYGITFQIKKKMYSPNKPLKTSLKAQRVREGETIERKLERMMKNGADLSDSVQEIFTERKDGVLPETDIRSDRHEIAVEAADKMSQLHLTKRDERHNPKKPDDATGDGGDHKSDSPKE